MKSVKQLNPGEETVVITFFLSWVIFLLVFFSHFNYIAFNLKTNILNLQV